jgi:predicted TIM-barrel fold metal-dependent hydrolase
MTNPFNPAPLLNGLTITVDIDVLIGRHPGADGPADHPAAGPAQVNAILAQRGIRLGATASLRAALFDMASGNDEVLDRSDLLPVGALDLRDPIGARAELERLAASGAAAVRLFPDEQGVEAGFPAVHHLARAATGLGLVILTGGDVRRFWQPFSGLDASVVFLDTHFYHLGDFLVVAADEPGFHTSTRLLTSPDALEIVAAQVGAQRLLFGSRTPAYEPLVPMLRLATSELSAADKDLVAGANALRLLGQAQ